MLRRLLQVFASAAAVLGLLPLTAGAAQLYSVGVAKIDITPGYPIRLTGYAARKAESTGIEQHLWAKALAIGSDKEKPALLITVDNCGVPGSIRDEVAARLKKERGLDPKRITICSTHTHCGPWLKGYLPNLFVTPLTAEEEAHIARYTREFTDDLEQVALQALADRQPARLSRGTGEAGFAANRRTKGGPTDHDLPALFVFSTNDTLRAVFTSYACHCTTMGGDFNHVCGDWAGYGAEAFAAEHPGAVALIALGCAGDSNPTPRGTLNLVKQYGQDLTTSLDRILTNSLRPVEGKLVCRLKSIELPYAALPTRAEWEKRAALTNYIGSHARRQLARLDRGEKLPVALPYRVQTWTFGDGLAMVFLSGEVVVDYSLRLKREFDASRLWVNAYANDVPCYIPSERVLKEGGYEGGLAMMYYDRPAPFAPGLENRIDGAVHDLLPRAFCAKADVSKAESQTKAP